MKRSLMSDKYFPLYLHLTRKNILVVGAGIIAQRRILTLLEFAGNITVIAPAATEKVRELSAQGRITYIEKMFEFSDLKNRDIVLASTSFPQLNDAIANKCHELGILVNCCSDYSQCDFLFPSIVEKDDLVIGITAGGNDHRKVKETRKKLEAALDISPDESKYL